MRKEDTVLLNTHFVVRRIEVLGLKQWWLAREIGVSEKTVNRWLTGRVKRVARYNAESLAAQLGCPSGEIILPDETDIYATREEQRVAAGLLQERDLLGLLSPSDNWVLAESLIKATMQPDLPLGHLGRLYNLLSITAWRQGNYDRARGHALRGLEIGRQCDDQGIIHKALFNLATIDSIVGRPVPALEGYEECLGRPEYFDTKRDHASALSNISMVYRDFGRFQESLECQRRCIRMFEELKLTFNLAIAWMSMTVILTELGLLEESLAAVEHARRYAVESGFTKALGTSAFYRADVLSLRGEHDRALMLVEEGLGVLKGFEVYDLFCHEIGVRVARRAGNLDEAGRLFAQALLRCEGFPIAQAHLLHEGARLAHARGDIDQALELVGRADTIHRELGLHARALERVPSEYGEKLTIDDSGYTGRVR